MANITQQTPEITEISLQRQADRTLDETSKTSMTESPAAGDHDHGDHDDTEAGLSRLEKITTSFGARPDCFKNTLQEVGFVTQATVAS